VTNGYVFCEASNVRVLDLRMVKIVEIVQDDDFMPDSEQLLGKMRPDKPGAASDHDSHSGKLATDGHEWTHISPLAHLSGGRTFNAYAPSGYRLINPSLQRGAIGQL
jgi:hypothetical protein